jgi:hypothetical protein
MAVFGQGLRILKKLHKLWVEGEKIMSEKLRVLLVNPPRVKDLPVVREERYEHRDVGSVYPPLSILQGAASLRKAGYDVQVLDCNGFDLRLEEVGRLLSSWEPHLVVARMAFDCQEEDLKVLQIAKAALPHGVTAIRNKIISEGWRKSPSVPRWTSTSWPNWMWCFPPWPR